MSFKSYHYSYFLTIPQKFIFASYCVTKWFFILYTGANFFYPNPTVLKLFFCMGPNMCR